MRYWIVMVLLLAGCAAAPTSQPGGAGPNVPGSQAPPQGVNPAVYKLMQQAEAQHSAGQLDQAAASVERAMRIAPKNGELVRALGQIRLEQHQPYQAEALGLRANSLSVGDDAAMARNWELIAAARKARGDTQGAKAARRAAEVLQGSLE